jgi:hypothetical protein
MNIGQFQFSWINDHYKHIKNRSTEATFFYGSLEGMIPLMIPSACSIIRPNKNFFESMHFQGNDLFNNFGKFHF